MYGVPSMEERMATAKKLMDNIIELRNKIAKRVEELRKDDEDLIKDFNEQLARYEETRLLKGIRDGELTVVHTNDGSPVNVAIL